MMRFAWNLPLSLLLAAAGGPAVAGGPIAAGAPAAAGGTAAAAALLLVQTIPLPDVEGRIDHLAVDVRGERLFVAALGNNTLEVVDLRAGVRVQRITGLHEPQGVGFDAGSNRLFVANGEDGALDVYDARTDRELGSVRLAGDADNVRVDAGTDRVYVGNGDGALAAVDVAGGKVIGSTTLGGHPESFELERTGRRIFVNVPSKDDIAVVDRDRARVVARWPLQGARANYPMALDEGDHRLLVGCRRPARLLVYDTESGAEVGNVAIDDDPDDVFFDPTRGRVYVSCGSGFLDVIEQRTPDAESVTSRLPTARGARTSLYVPELHRLYLAVPHEGAQRAEIRVYAAAP